MTSHRQGALRTNHNPLAERFIGAHDLRRGRACGLAQINEAGRRPVIRGIFLAPGRSVIAVMARSDGQLSRMFI